jgi:hypothetical protein
MQYSAVPEKSAVDSKKTYNVIFKQLVNDKDDFVGMIAYALYKEDKVKFIEAIKSQNHDVKDESIDNFHAFSLTKIEDYRESANTILSTSIEEVINQEAQITITQIKTVVDASASPKGAVNWLRTITQNVIASVIYSIIIFFLWFFFWASTKPSDNSNGVKEQAKETVDDLIGCSSNHSIHHPDHRIYHQQAKRG